MSSLLRFALKVLPWVVACCAGLSGATDDAAQRVIILANRDDPDSVRIAQHYAEARKIPVANIVALPMPVSETITWAEFVHTIWEPLLAQLVRDRWIEAIPMKLADNVGRTKYAVSGHRIAFLVPCRGVPLRIMHEPTLYEPILPFTKRVELRTNCGAVDAELAMLPRPNYSINAFIPNPLYLNDQPHSWEAVQVLKVSRLDGPTAEDALALVDHALEAERTGLLGRAYVDLGAGKHELGERWLTSVAQQMAETGLDTDVDRSRDTFGPTARFDAPVIYFGWYTHTIDGPFKLPGFRFPPGAVAVHIHSNSAETLRSDTAYWCAPLVARGVTATVGNVFEPYLEFLHRPDLLLRALVRGDSFGDAACFALPVLSWQSISIGDPLYRPFKKTFGEQWANRKQLSSRLAGYATARKMKALQAQGHAAEATALGRAAQREEPSLAVASELARELQAGGDLNAAAEVLGFVADLEKFAADELALAAELAAMLHEAGRSDAAVKVYRTILNTEDLPRAALAAWLPAAQKTALAAHDASQAAEWKRRLERLAAVSNEKK